jgi:hypothetical protein
MILNCQCTSAKLHEQEVLLVTRICNMGIQVGVPTCQLYPVVLKRIAGHLELQLMCHWANSLEVYNSRRTVCIAVRLLYMIAATKQVCDLQGGVPSATQRISSGGCSLCSCSPLYRDNGLH